MEFHITIEPVEVYVSCFMYFEPFGSMFGEFYVSINGSIWQQEGKILWNNGMLFEYTFLYFKVFRY